jgi:multiple sugar transport system ATP-binding protein
MAAIKLEHVTKVFQGGVKAVDDVSMDISDGEFVVLVGPSGCGKSTLLRSLAGLEDVDGGSVWIGDVDVTDKAPRERDVAMVFQSYALYPQMSVRQNLGYGLKVRRTPKAEVRKRVEAVAGLLGLSDLLDRRPAQLSGGQRQRVAMGRAIVREPKAFLMDEPLSNLDAKLRVGMRASLSQLHARLRVTTIYVTHDQVEAMTLGQRVAVMRDGRIVQADSPQALYAAPHDLFVAGFIGSPAMNLFEAEISGDDVIVGQHHFPLHPARRPPPGRERVVIGIRPEAFESAVLAPAHLPRIDVVVEVVEELGSDVFLVFPIEARRVAASEHGEDETRLLMESGALCTARIDPSADTRVAEDVTLAVDPARFYFFDPDTEENLLSPPRAAQASAPA